MSVNIFDSCMSTNCCHSLNRGWIETVTDLPGCVIFIAEGTLCLIPPAVFYWIQEDIFHSFHFLCLQLNAAAERSWMTRWRTNQVFLAPASGLLGLNGLKVRDGNVHYFGFWGKKTCFCICKTASDVGRDSLCNSLRKCIQLHIWKSAAVWLWACCESTDRPGGELMSRGERQTEWHRWYSRWLRVASVQLCSRHNSLQITNICWATKA